jgi:predicted DCC family thiol-disulfide oxidoreductase YuxK
VIAPRSRPLLIFDGECGFCRYWVNYWRARTGSAVDYAPYQEVGAEFAEIPVEAFARSIYFIGTDGHVAKGAEASFRTLSCAPERRPWLWLYLRVPGFAIVTEALYAWISGHRYAFARLSRLLFGPALHPARHVLVADCLQRGLGLIYLFAIVSFWSQAQGLIGSQGILPVRDLMDSANLEPSAFRVWWLPSLFWLNSSDRYIAVLCGVGSCTALTTVVFAYWRECAFGLLFVIYLSLVHAGQMFTTYQWDYLLLEAGFLAIFLRIAPTPFVWLCRWLLFRFMWEAGLVKLGSGDVAWLGLSALDYHFFTQPLPTPLAWYAQHLPEAVKQVLAALVLAIELVVPWLLFMPRRLRRFAAWAFISLQLGILLTGNYGFFNLLTLVLCVGLFDDADLQRLAPRWWLTKDNLTRRSPLAGLVALLLVASSTAQLSQRWFGSSPLTPALRLIEHWHIVNNYGPFAIMTRTRHELSVEGSNDGRDWRPYRFKFKPDAVEQAPRWCVVHQPRLDWQFWFAALAEERPLWLWHFLRRLQQGAAPVLRLLAEDPFPGQPPRYLRVRIYDYQFTTSGSDWWQRTVIGIAD